ncbi:threonine synthase [Sarocladium strictum]
MTNSTGPVLQCYSCNEEFPLDSCKWVCPCDGVLDIVRTSIFPRDQLSSRPWNFWRYHEALAIGDDRPRASLGEVITPLLPAKFRDMNVQFKLEYLLPSGSYKDRGVAVCINQLLSHGITAVSEDSSGNAGASTAAYAAAAGMRADIFVPESTSPAKINQVRIYGAQCQLVPGDRTASAAEAQKPREGNLYIGHSWSPFFACGIKSVAFEIAEQSNWTPPDWIVTPAGGGSLVMGLIEGFRDLHSARYMTKLPRILVVQAEFCAPIHKAWTGGRSHVEAVEPQKTMAEGAALPDPCRGTQVLEAIRAYGASVMAVDEMELSSCWRDLAKVGIYVEPTSALAVAGAWLAKERDELIKEGESTVVLLTGHGLKTNPVYLRQGEEMA